MLKDKIIELATKEGLNTLGIEGVDLYKMTQPYTKLTAVISPAICFIVQGSKNLYLGEEVFSYDARRYLIGTVKMPIESELKDASKEKPYLGLILHIDSSLISELLNVCDDFEQNQRKTEQIIVTSSMTARLENSLERLLDIAHSEMDIKVLSRSFLREVYYEILKGPQGHVLRNSAMQHAKAHQMVPTIKYMEKNFKKEISIDELARYASMSVSSLHENFKKATSLSPIQFIKQLRLHHAHSLLLSGYNASNAAIESGYTNAAQFSREFKRLFGHSPREVKLGAKD